MPPGQQRRKFKLDETLHINFHINVSVVSVLPILSTFFSLGSIEMCVCKTRNHMLNVKGVRSYPVLSDMSSERTVKFA
jgi:hypothetical protein